MGPPTTSGRAICGPPGFCAWSCRTAMTHIFRDLMAPVALLVAFAAGTWVGRADGPLPRALARQPPPAFSCPMHPGYRLARPGACPACGMRLVPVSVESADGEAAPSGGANLLRVDPARRQLSGVRIGAAELSSSPRAFRVFGTVVPIEEIAGRLEPGMSVDVVRPVAGPPGPDAARRRGRGHRRAPHRVRGPRRRVFRVPARRDRLARRRQGADRLRPRGGRAARPCPRWGSNVHRQAHERAQRRPGCRTRSPTARAAPACRSS